MEIYTLSGIDVYAQPIPVGASRRERSARCPM